MKIAGIYIEKDVPTEDNGLIYSNVCNILNNQGVEIINGGKITGGVQAEKTVADLMGIKPDILLLVVLSGKSAPVIETIGKTSTVPLLIWAIGRNFSFPSSALACGALKETGCLFHLIHGEPDNEKTISEVLDIICVSHAIIRLKRSKIGLIGGLFFNLVSCKYDPAFINEKFGIDLKSVSYDEMQNLMLNDDIMNEDELKDLERLCCSFSLHVPVKLLIPGLKLHMVLKYLAKSERIDAFAIECWSGLPKTLGLNPCLGFIEDSYIIACEGDVVLGIMLLAIKYMVNFIPFAGDIQCIDENNIITICHCGASASLAVNGDVILDKSSIAEEQGFSTVTCRPRLDNGFVTLVRLYGKKCEYMHIACGEIIDLDRSNSFTASIKLSGKREDFIEECLGNHYIVASGDIRKKLYLFGKWMQINIKES